MLNARQRNVARLMIGQESGGSISHFVHYLLYRARKPRTRLETAMMIVSVDVDVGNRKLGAVNEGKNDMNVNDHFTEYMIGEMEERALPLIIDCFNTFGVPATFAIRGQLMEVDTSVLEYLRESPIKHDIGAHGYYHRDFTLLSRDEARHDLKLTSTEMNKVKIKPKSFVFPRNHVAHLDLLQEFGYLCYRGYGDVRSDAMLIQKHGRLYNVHPSLYLGYVTNPAFTKKIIDLAIAKRLPIHVWFHPWNLGDKEKSISTKINRLLLPIFQQAKSRQKTGLLEFETMRSAAEKVESTEKVSRTTRNTGGCRKSE